MKWLLLCAFLLTGSRALAVDGGLRDAGPSDASLSDARVPDSASAADAACGMVDELGECAGNVLRACVGGALKETDCVHAFGPGFQCILTDGLGAAQCLYETVDGGLNPDAGDLSDAAVHVAPPPPASGCGCVRPSPLEGALLMSTPWFLGPLRRRSKRRTPTSPRT